MNDQDSRKSALECEKLEQEILELRWKRWISLGNMFATLSGASAAVTLAMLKLLE
ncbi:MAG: hypothetical protein H6851_09625 [Geminicoccaceae bacterium]|nr:hypothetical protein [Geminicoccaceae bacterium]